MLRNEEGVQSMRNIAFLTVVALAALVVVMAHAGPAYAAQSAVAVSNSGTAVTRLSGLKARCRLNWSCGATAVVALRFAQVVAMLSAQVASDHSVALVSIGSIGSTLGTIVSLGHLFGSVAVPYAYSSYYNNCYWNGYQWVCPNDYLY